MLNKQEKDSYSKDRHYEVYNNLFIEKNIVLRLWFVQIDEHDDISNYY